MPPQTQPTPSNGGASTAAAKRTGQFEVTQRDAEAAGLPRYEAWCASLERRYTVMPPWYWDGAKRRAGYSDHIRASLEWQQRQARINAGNRQFFERLRGDGVP